jgi:DNA-directed RNA polymerase subunit RPC12/RpoP
LAGIFSTVRLNSNFKMSKDLKRYSGPATVRQSYMNEYSVVCPKCEKEAFVTVDDPYFLNEGKLTCYNCHHVEKAGERIKYNAIVKRTCDNCGKAFEQIIPNNKRKVITLTIPCPYCSVTRTFKPRNEEYIKTYNKRGLTDPIFRLTLWLQCDVKGNLFWAFNKRHLNEIGDYVSSTLRERQTNNYTTMVEKLPSFIKESKNRSAVIKAIAKLSTK